jgi:outer membrane protein with beta-barrel domain
MRSATCFIAAALALGLAGTAAAQTPGTYPATTQNNIGPVESHWTASGFIGSGFGTEGNALGIDENGGGVAFGGQLAYLWHGVLGPEFIADWAPTFDVTSPFVDNNPRLASYMANLIGAFPLGSAGQVVPYLSGGFGSIGMRADVVNLDGTFSGNSEMRWGSNIGGGVMAFATRRVGFRGDIRYYSASTDDQLNEGISAQGQVVQRLISGLTFWRTTGGVTFRW